MNLLAELRRRSVFRVAATYLISGWAVMQVVGVEFSQAWERRAAIQSLNSLAGFEGVEIDNYLSVTMVPW